MLQNISALSNSDGDFFYTTNTNTYDKLSSKDEWSYAAPLFDSFSGPSSVGVHRLMNDQLGAIVYAYKASDIRGRVRDGWKDEGEAFRASPTKTGGLTAIHQLYRGSDTSYTYAYNDALIGEMKADGYKDQGIAWYSHVNDGMIDIDKHEFDPVTGKLRVSYSLDELHLSQFRAFKNTLTFRAIGEDSNGQIHAADLNSRSLKLGNANEKTGLTSGVISLNIYKSFGSKPGDLSNISLSINSKYGKSTDSRASSYGFVRSTCLHLSGKNLGKSKISNSGDLEDVGFTNLMSLTEGNTQLALGSTLSTDITPGAYYREPTIENEDLRGADFSRATLAEAHINRNNFTGANFTSTNFCARVEKIDILTSIDYPSYLYQNNMEGASMQGFRYYFPQTTSTDYGSGQNLISNYKGVPGTIENDSAYKVTRIIVENKSSQTDRIWMGSPQFALIQEIRPGQTVELSGAAFASWDGKYWGGGRRDVYALITTPDKRSSGILSAYNPALGEAHFFIGEEEQDDDGSEGIISWAFNPDSDYKEWKVTIN